MCQCYYVRAMILDNLNDPASKQDGPDEYSWHIYVDVMVVDIFIILIVNLQTQFTD